MLLFYSNETKEPQNIFLPRQKTPYLWKLDNIDVRLPHVDRRSQIEYCALVVRVRVRRCAVDGNVVRVVDPRSDRLQRVRIDLSDRVRLRRREQIIPVQNHVHKTVVCRVPIRKNPTNVKQCSLLPVFFALRITLDQAV